MIFELDGIGRIRDLEEDGSHIFFFLLHLIFTDSITVELWTVQLAWNLGYLHIQLEIVFSENKKKKPGNRLIVGSRPILLNNTILELICYLVYISKAFGDTGDEFF